MSRPAAVYVRDELSLGRVMIVRAGSDPNAFRSVVRSVLRPAPEETAVHASELSGLAVVSSLNTA